MSAPAPTRRTRLAIAAAGLLTTATLAAASAGLAPPTAAPAHRAGPVTVTPASADAPHRYVGTVGEGLAAKNKRSIAGTAAALYTCQTTTPYHCLVPSDVRTAYGVDQLPQNGAGRTIAIVAAYSAPNVENDLARFNQLFGLPAAQLTIRYAGGKTTFDPTDAEQLGWAAEISLDVQWAHALAPAAKIQLILAKSGTTDDILAAQTFAVRKSGADVISMSFGANEACYSAATLSALEKLWTTARNKGVTLIAASGDQGVAVASCNGTSLVKGVLQPAADDQVTAVGGTLLATGSNGAYGSETTWNEPSLHLAGGGGVSTTVARPSYQASVSSSTQRTLPDVAYNAGVATGVLTVWSDSSAGPNAVFAFGGTSAGAPQWAGLVALAAQRAGDGVGQINPTLYQLAGTPASYAANFRDVTTGNNTYNGTNQTITGFSAGTGYDLATGLGSPRANSLVPALAGG